MQDNDQIRQEHEEAVKDNLSNDQERKTDDGGAACESDACFEDKIFTEQKTDSEISADEYAKADDLYAAHVKPREPEVKIVYNVRRRINSGGDKNYVHVVNQHVEVKRTKSPVAVTIFLSLVVLAFIAYATVFYMQNFDGKINWPSWPSDGNRSDFGVILSPPVLVSDDNAILENLPRAPIGGKIKMSLATSPDQDTLSKQEIYKKCSSSVVAIMAKTEDDSNQFWGSGVILTDDGYILTNYHILEKGTVSVTVTLTNDREYTAELVGIDEYTDIAVLKINAKNLPVAEFGDSALLEEGEDVLAIGNPLGKELRGTVTNGIISAINRDIDYGGYTMTLLQTTAAINEGNSGGPLINMHGQVIGITHMKMVSYYVTVEGIAFAIPSRSIKPVVDEIIELGYVSGRPAIGVWVREISESFRNSKDLPEGVYVDGVYDGTDASLKGVKAGDVIVAVEGKLVKTSADMNAIKDNLHVGDPLILTIYRDGETFEVEIELCDMADLKN